jgi:hypothetical protein
MDIKGLLAAALKQVEKGRVLAKGMVNRLSNQFFNRQPQHSRSRRISLLDNAIAGNQNTV